ncbi:hypothetical protein [Halopelagius fulvigenes]|uniref:Uncharacterized protein n=1 Tax=Halopelagius fulvigenes TaxID=1198324 RepID=A0ABD5U413_9EURY
MPSYEAESMDLKRMVAGTHVSVLGLGAAQFIHYEIGFLVVLLGVGITYIGWTSER